MEDNYKFDLILNFLAHGESMFMDDRRYQDFANTASNWLSRQGKHFFKDELMARFSTDKTFEQILEQRKHEFIPGQIVQRGKKREQIYYDIWSGDKIEAGDSFFSYFFACKLSHIDILQTDDFLNYHLEKSFENETEKFVRFLQLIFRQYATLIKPDTITTANEWISAEQKKPALSGTESETQKKARVKRDAGDNITSLNLAQTSYLINLLKQSKVIIKDDTILTSKTAGEAFSLLTGYSPDTLRLKMNLKGQHDLNRQDRAKVRQTLYDIVALIDKDINEQKGSKS